MSRKHRLPSGFGFRCGFLGLLHMDIVKERLEREFKLDLIPTAPTVVYRVTKNDGEIVMVDNPAKMPDIQDIQRIEEPMIVASLITPEQYVGSLIALCQERRGIQREIEYITKDRVRITYDLPLNEIVMDFYDRLKSLTKGYASLDYELSGLCRVRPRETRYADERRTRGRAVAHHAPGQGRDPRQAACGETQRSDPATIV